MAMGVCMCARWGARAVSRWQDRLCNAATVRLHARVRVLDGDAVRARGSFFRAEHLHHRPLLRAATRTPDDRIGWNCEVRTHGASDAHEEGDQARFRRNGAPTATRRRAILIASAGGESDLHRDLEGEDLARMDAGSLLECSGVWSEGRVDLRCCKPVRPSSGPRVTELPMMCVDIPAPSIPHSSPGLYQIHTR